MVEYEKSHILCSRCSEKNKYPIIKEYLNQEFDKEILDYEEAGPPDSYS